MFCAKCGRQIDDNAKFCKYCGTVISNVSNKEFYPCMKCGGKGTRKSTVCIVISLIITMIIMGLIMQIPIIYFYVDSGGFIVTAMALAIVALALYWGFKDRICDVCHGSGKLYK